MELTSCSMQKYLLAISLILIFLFLYIFIIIFFSTILLIFIVISRIFDAKVLTADESKLARTNEFNFDSPDAFDFDLLAETIAKLRDGKRVDVPIYNFVSHSREKRTVNNIFFHFEIFFVLMTNQ